MSIQPDGKHCFAYKMCSHCDGREYKGEVSYRRKQCSCCGKRTAVLSAVVIDFKVGEKKDESR